jgi:thioredoxin-related protein
MRFLARLCLALLMLPAFAPGARAVEWKSWNAGLASAASSRRPVVVDVYTDWCRWCKQMDRDVYGRAEIGQYLASHFVTVKLNAESGEAVTYEGRGTNARALATSFGVSGYPTTIFLTAKGEHLANVPGYIEPERFLLLLRFIGDGHMDRGVKWDDYVKKSGGAR